MQLGTELLWTSEALPFFKKKVLRQNQPGHIPTNVRTDRNRRHVVGQTNEEEPALYVLGPWGPVNRLAGRFNWRDPDISHPVWGEHSERSSGHYNLLVACRWGAAYAADHHSTEYCIFGRRSARKKTVFFPQDRIFFVTHRRVSSVSSLSRQLGSGLRKTTGRCSKVRVRSFAPDLAS